jgi:hypothetical protein
MSFPDLKVYDSMRSTATTKSPDVILSSSEWICEWLEASNVSIEMKYWSKERGEAKGKENTEKLFI